MSKILVIDRDGVVRDALSVFLTRDGHQVVTAEDGVRGIRAFCLYKPDLVIMCRDLGVMTGSQVLKKLREISKTVPVVLLTRADSPQAAVKYMESGATSFLSKTDGLLNALAEVDRILCGVKAAPAAPVPPVLPARAVDRRRHKVVLVVDDDKDLSQLLGCALAAEGYEVLLAEDGERGIGVARELRPDIVLLDIAMPKKDGVHVLKELVPEMPDTGFLMLSGNGDEEVARACMRIGAFDYIIKPPKIAALKAVIRARLLCCGKNAPGEKAAGA